MRAGVIQVQNSAGQIIPYNLNPRPVSVGGVTYQPAMCSASLCDPHGIGLNPLVSTSGTSTCPCPTIPRPATGTTRKGTSRPCACRCRPISWLRESDHDFGQNWRLMTGYRYYLYFSDTTSGRRLP